MTIEEYEKLQIPCFKSAILNLTDSCNCNCKYCFMNFNPQEMTWETAKKSIDWLYRVWLRRIGLLNQDMIIFNLPSLTFFGGEPMLRWDDLIVPCLEYIDLVINPKIKKIYPEGYMSINITTNGTLLSPDRIRLLKKYNCQILLSIDGDKKTQDYNRPLRNGESSFDKINKNIPYLLKYYPNTTFRSTVTPDSVDELYNNFLFAINSGFTNYFVTPNKYEDWTLEKREKLRSEMYKIGLTILYFIMEEKYINYSLLNNFLISQFKTQQEKTTIQKCGLGTQTISIGTDGALFGCQEEASKPNSIYKIGHIDSGIDKDLHFELLNKMNSNSVLSSETRECEKCPCYNYCASTYCTVTNYSMTGDPNKSCDIDCEWKTILHDTAILMLYQAEKENSEPFLEYLKNLIPGGRKK